MTIAARDIPRIALEPLNDLEIDAVFELLVANLSKKKDETNLIRTIANMQLATPVSLELTELKTGGKAKSQPVWKLDTQVHLQVAQDRWRSAAHGPDIVNDPKTDFDLYQLENYRYFRIPPFVIKNRTIYQSRELFHPSLCIHVKSAQDVFDWLLVRAAVNRQLSRFAHCVVCGKWVLKERAGKRSVRVRKYQLKHKPNIWPDFMYHFPSWPGLCNTRTCQSKFTSIFPDKKRKYRPRSKFSPEDFHGLRPASPVPLSRNSHLT